MGGAFRDAAMIGAYGQWAAETLLGDGPGRLSFRTGHWPTVDDWRRAARDRVIECLAPVDAGGPPEPRVVATEELDGLEIEHLRWQLPYGPETEAVLLKPAGAGGPLPGVLALHDHGGMKYLGWRKIVRTADLWPVQESHQERGYEGVGWATELARRGYVVLVHDTFPFASRRIRVADVAEAIRGQGVDPDPHDGDGIAAYNAWAAQHEHILAKALCCAGTTFAGVYLPEDQRALDVLCARPEVDASRVGCGGLSGGGMRTVYLGGLDPRIRCCVCVGHMTTWREWVSAKCWTSTWMIYVPHLPRDLDFPEILALRAPLPAMVQNCTEDPLFTMGEMQRADRMMADVYARAGAGDQYACRFYPGGHKFDLAMQRDAFAWFDQHLS